MNDNMNVMKNHSNIFLLNPLCKAGYTYNTLYNHLTKYFNAEVVEPVDFLDKTFSKTKDNVTLYVSNKSDLSYPVYMIGFSASGLIGTSVAEELLKLGYNVKLILIDTFPMMEDFLTSITKEDVAYRFFYNLWRGKNLQAPLNESEFKEKFGDIGIKNEKMKDLVANYKEINPDEDFEKEFAKSVEFLYQLRSEVTNVIKVNTFLLLAKDGIERYPKFIANVGKFFSTMPTIKLYSYYHMELIFSEELCVDVLRYISATQSC